MLSSSITGLLTEDKSFPLHRIYDVGNQNSSPKRTTLQNDAMETNKRDSYSVFGFLLALNSAEDDVSEALFGADVLSQALSALALADVLLGFTSFLLLITTYKQIHIHTYTHTLSVSVTPLLARLMSHYCFNRWRWSSSVMLAIGLRARGRSAAAGPGAWAADNHGGPV